MVDQVNPPCIQSSGEKMYCFSRSFGDEKKPSQFRIMIIMAQII